MTLLERLTILLAQIHDGLHVDFVEGGQHRGAVLRFQQTLGNALTQTRHRHAFFAAVSHWLLRGSRISSRCCRFSSLRLVGQVFFNIFTGQTSAHTAAFNLRGVEIVLCNQAADSRAERIVALFFQ